MQLIRVAMCLIQASAMTVCFVLASSESLACSRVIRDTCVSQSNLLANNTCLLRVCSRAPSCSLLPCRTLHSVRSHLFKCFYSELLRTAVDLDSPAWCESYSHTLPLRKRCTNLTCVHTGTLNKYYTFGFITVNFLKKLFGSRHRVGPASGYRLFTASI